jgi:arylformamidase
MSDRIYLHYSKAELDRNFDQRGWVSNALEVIGRYPLRSAATRARLAHRPNVPYGKGADEVLDIFPAPDATGAVQIFVHGGAWKNFTKDDYSFPADAYVPAGIHTVVVNFSNLPAVRLPDMVAQVRRAFKWVYVNAASFGGDPEKIYVSAHSSGAHLAAMALQGYAASSHVPEDFIKGAVLVSGPYFLEPVVLSARSDYVKLSKEEVFELSPALHADRMPCPTVISYAEYDTDEFQRQSREFAAALEKASRLQRAIRFPNVNHFELMEKFGDARHPLIGVILQQMGQDKEPKGAGPVP